MHIHWMLLLESNSGLLRRMPAVNAYGTHASKMQGLTAKKVVNEDESSLPPNKTPSPLG